MYPILQAWTKLSGLPFPATVRYNSLNILMGRMLIFAGGSVIGASRSSDVDGFDLDTNTWTSFPALPSTAHDPLLVPVKANILWKM